jgi:hypothetical protein
VPAFNPAWLHDPTRSAELAAQKAYARAGIESSDIALVEMTDLTRALTNPLQKALGAEHLGSMINRHGGVRSNHPGIADGLLRLIEASEVLAEAALGGPAVVHTTDDLMGLVSATSSVFVMEAP